MTNAWFNHRSAKYFDRPDTFDHCRFAADAPHPVSEEYLPFSQGKRGCPGQLAAHCVIKLIAARFLQRTRSIERATDAVAPTFAPSLMLPNTPQSCWLRAEWV